MTESWTLSKHCLAAHRWQPESSACIIVMLCSICLLAVKQLQQLASSVTLCLLHPPIL